jgi:hypothetical protein
MRACAVGISLNEMAAAARPTPQASQAPDAPVLLRLRSATAGSHAADPVLLFCRGAPDMDRGYVYCGKLEVRSVDTSVRPVAFVWSLTNYEAVRRTAAFVALLEADAAARVDEE